MDKELPNIYKGVVNNSNNQDSSILREKIKKEEAKDYNDVEKDIKKILTSKEFIYRADVLITLKDNSKIKKTIIGTNNNSLITIDDELIDINRIQEIELI
jgi:hypothetical protein